jgi:hypothetical protein
MPIPSSRQEILPALLLVLAAWSLYLRRNGRE